MPGVLDSMDYIGQKMAEGEARGKQSRLAGLMSQAMQAPQEKRGGLLAQMASVSPQAAYDAHSHLSSMDDDAKAQMGQYAMAFDALPDEQKPQAYPRFAMEMQRMGLPAPPSWDPAYGPRIKQFASAWGGGGVGGNIQSTFVDGDGNRVAIRRDGSTQVLGRNDQGMVNQTITVEGPNGEPMQYTFNKRTGNYQPMGAGAQQAPQPTQGLTAGMYQSPGGLVRVGNDLTPAEAEAMQADIASGGASDNYRLPDRDVSAQQRIGVGMGAAEKAAAQEAAKQGVQTQFLPQQEAIKTDAAIRQAAGVAAANASAERDATAATKGVDASRTLDLLRQAEALIPESTGSAAGNAVDAIAAVGGKSTRGAQAIASLQTIAGLLTSSMPRMQGPQSDKDVQLYKQMAGDLANPTLPRETRMAALRTIRALNQKYANQGNAPRPAARGDDKPSNRFQGFKVLD